jgi:hypothetical protein
MTLVNSYPSSCVRAVCAALLLAATACLKPASETGELYSSYVLPPNAHVRLLEDEPGAAKKLDANDGLGMTIPLRSAFVGGSEVQYWDFGPITAISVKPMWIFRSRGADMALEVDHPNLIDSIPGDTPYTPLRQLFLTFVTDAYRGERITSLRALEDAVEMGLLEAPQPQDVFVNCVVALSTVQRQISKEGAMDGPQPAYYRGRVVNQFCVGGFVANVGAFQLKDGSFTPGNAFLLRRENETQPLDEALLKADLNADGDMLDTNTVYDSKPDPNDMTYTSVWKSIDVLVPREYMFGEAKAQSDLFTGKGSNLVGKAGKVVQYRDTGVFLNRPIRQEPQ